MAGEDNRLDASQRILRALREARERIERLEGAGREPIAIVGMGCRFPGGADSPAAFWELLQSGRDAIGDIPAGRWDVEALYDPDPGAKGRHYVKRGGFIRDVDLFDPEYFRISPREAERLDPQQRLVLEVGLAALGDAGISVRDLSGTETGVFVGMGQNDYARLSLNAGDVAGIDIYDGTGNLSCFAAGRLAHFLGVTGPNLVLDTACSSSLVAIHLACRSLRARECDTAVAGGVHLVLSPEITIFLSRTRVLSPDGVCRAFDAGAEGFGRGEGCGMVVLRRLSDAENHGDRILALIRGGAVNHDGASGGLTVPSEAAQEAVIRKALADAGVPAAQVGYVEAHGTGTPLGDPIEAGALAGVFRGVRTPEDPLLLGSVKTNIGHLEAAAGVAGVIKTVLALNHGIVPPHLHFRLPTPHIPWDRVPLRVAAGCTPFPVHGERAVAGVSSFGMSGTNAHLILEAPASPAGMEGRLPEPRYRRRRFWVASPATPAAPWVAHRSGHPLAGVRMSLPHSAEIRFESRLGAASPPYMDHHRVFGKAVAPAAAHVALVAAAALEAFGTAGITLEDVVFSRALVLPEQGERSVQLILNPGEDGGFRFRLISCEDERSASSSGAWITHAQGALRPLDPEPNGGPPRPELPEIMGRLSGTLSPGAFYEGLNGAGFTLGESFRWITGVWRGYEEAICRLEIPSLPDDPSAYPVYPGLLDGAFQLLSTFWETSPEELAGGGALFVPFRLDRFALFRSADHGKTMWCHATAGDPGSSSGDLTLFSETDGAMAEASGFRFLRAERKSLFPETAGPDESLIRGLVWMPEPLSGGAAEKDPGRWLIFCDRRGTGELLSRLLEEKGARTILVSSDSLQGADPAPALAEAAGKLRNGGPWSVVWLRALDLPPLEGEVPAGGSSLSDPSDLSRGCEALADLFRQLAAMGGDRPRGLWVITRGVYAPEGPVGPEALSQSPLWGMGRVLQLEHPELGCRLVDLEPGVGAPGQLAEMLSRDSGAGAPQRMFRRGRSYIPRLEPWQETAGGSGGDSPPMPMIRREGAYLITGGMGTLGLAMAEGFARLGASRLVLLGRREPGALQKERIAVMEKAGARVSAILCDVSDRDRLKMVLEEIRNEGRALCGVVHAAGVVDDGLLIHQTRERFSGVMKPKIAGAWNLHLLTREMPLDFMVFFSSTAALLGSVGQGNYAAANHFLDTLAQYRRSLGLPALSVNWGPWRDGGMAARVGSRAQGRWTLQGISGIGEEEGFRILCRLLRSNVPQAAVIRADWDRFAAAFARGGGHPLMGGAAGAPAGTSVSGREKASLGVRLEAAKPGEGLSLLTDHVRRAVAGILKMPDGPGIGQRQRLFDMGMDSMMALELKNRLESDTGLKLPATLVFDYPTVEDLAGFLAERLPVESHGDDASPLKGARPPEKSWGAVPEEGEAGLSALLPRIEKMSDEDILETFRK